MAGRPRTMAKKAWEWEIAAYHLTNEIHKAIPEQYRKDPAPKDRVARAWKDSLNAADHLWTTLQDLGDELREKAGIDDNGPTWTCRLGVDDLTQAREMPTTPPADEPAPALKTAER